MKKDLKKTIVFNLLIASTMICDAQNVGIGTIQPKEKLEINGALKIGSTKTNNTGTIKWDGKDFLGFNGNSWLSMTESIPPGSIIVSPEENNELLQNGYSYFGKSLVNFQELEEPTEGWESFNAYDFSTYSPIRVDKSTSHIFCLSRRLSDDKIVLHELDINSQDWILKNTNILADYRRNFAFHISEEHVVFWGGEDFGYSNDGYIYDIENNSWSALSTLTAPSARAKSILTIVGDHLYLYGGQNNSGILNESYKYDLTLNKWTSISTISEMDNLNPVLNIHLQVANGWLLYNNADTPSIFFYKFGSTSWAARSILNGPTQTMLPPLQKENTLIFWGSLDSNQPSSGYIYNVLSDSWEQISATNGPVGIFNPNRLIYRDSLFVFGGLNTSNGQNTVSSHGWILNLKTKKWANMSMPESDIGQYLNYTEIVNNQIFSFGGYINLNLEISTLGAIYDIQSNTWRMLLNSPSDNKYLKEGYRYQQIFELNGELILTFPTYFDSNGNDIINSISYKWCSNCVFQNVDVPLYYYLKD